MTPAEFQPVLEHWHDFFLLTGTAAATLVGLLFVALSINLDVMLADPTSHLLQAAQQAFFSFLATLLVSLLFLVPHPSIRPLGTELLGLGAMMLIASIRRIALISGHANAAFPHRHLARRHLFGTLAAVLVIVAGVSLARRDLEGLYYLVLGMCMVLASAMGSAWDLLVRVGRLRSAPPPRGD